MIRPLFTIKDKYQIKDIYIWGNGVYSEKLLSYLLLHYVRIKGFVSTDDQYIGEVFFNCPVVSLKNVDEKDGIIIYHKNVLFKDDWICKDTRFVEIDDVIGDLNPELSAKNVFICCGMGHEPKGLIDRLKDIDIVPTGYVETYTHYGKVYEGDEFHVDDLNSDDALLISADESGKLVLLNMYRFLNADIFYEYGQIDKMKYTAFSLVVHKGLIEKKKLIIYGKKSTLSESINYVLSLYGIHELTMFDISEIYDQVSGLSNKSTIIIDALLPEEIVDIRRRLKEIGMTVNGENTTGYFARGISDKSLLGVNKVIWDPLLHGSLHLEKNEYTGWAKLGKNEEGTIKIIVLGGSTSSIGLFEVESWVEKLYKKLKSKSIASIIYVGACPAATSNYELIKLLRDGICIKPDFVISMSGLNDTWNNCYEMNPFNILLDDEYPRKKMKNTCLGMSREGTAFDNWIHNEQVMKIYSEMIGAKFLSFLQPMNLFMTDASLEERMQFEYEDCIIDAKSFYENSKEYDFYINLVSLFQNKADMFIDDCHYSEKGSDILSDEVLRWINA